MPDKFNNHSQNNHSSANTHPNNNPNHNNNTNHNNSSGGGGNHSNFPNSVPRQIPDHQLTIHASLQPHVDNSPSSPRHNSSVNRTSLIDRNSKKSSQHLNNVHDDNRMSDERNNVNNSGINPLPIHNPDTHVNNNNNVNNNNHTNTIEIFQHFHNNALDATSSSGNNANHNAGVLMIDALNVLSSTPAENHTDPLDNNINPLDNDNGMADENYQNSIDHAVYGNNHNNRIEIYDNRNNNNANSGKFDSNINRVISLGEAPLSNWRLGDGDGSDEENNSDNNIYDDSNNNNATNTDHPVNPVHSDGNETTNNHSANTKKRRSRELTNLAIGDNFTPAPDSKRGKISTKKDFFLVKPVYGKPKSHKLGGSSVKATLGIGALDATANPGNSNTGGSKDLPIMKILSQDTNENWKVGHLLNAKRGGPAGNPNFTPLTAGGNSQHETWETRLENSLTILSQTLERTNNRKLQNEIGIEYTITVSNKLIKKEVKFKSGTKTKVEVPEGLSGTIQLVNKSTTLSNTELKRLFRQGKNLKSGFYDPLIKQQGLENIFNLKTQKFKASNK